MKSDNNETQPTYTADSEAETFVTDRADYVATDQLSEFESSELPTADYSNAMKDQLEAKKPLDFTGRKIGPYRLEEELGRGGMGIVYKAVRDDGELRMTVAIKLIKRALVNAEVVGRFKRERQLLADLRHPHIAPLLDAGTTEDGLPYFIMDYVDGTTIDHYCRTQDLDLEDLLRLFRKVLAAVALAHRKGVIHRDIKPGNVLVTSEGEPVLLDFGIAHTVHADDNLGEGRVGMTPAYAAPEQIRGKPATPRFDIFALGLLLLEMRTGSRLRRGQVRAEDQIRRLESSPDSTHWDTLDLGKSSQNELDPQIPEELAELLVAALAEDPEKRYATCEQMLSDLDYLLTSLALTDGSGRVTNPAFHDCLVLYNQDDLGLVQNLTKKLQERGIDLITAHEQEEPERIASSLAGVRTCLVCKGKQSSGPWVESAIKETIAQRVRRGQLRVVPLLLPEARRPRRESKLPSFLRRRSWVQLEEVPSKSLLDELADQLLGRESTLDTGFDQSICPFRGLEVFREEDRRFFFGREAVTERLVAHMQENRFLAVLGPSGSGKSSVVQAGLIPALREGGYDVAMFTPANKPLFELGTALEGLFAALDASQGVAQITRRLHQDERSLGFLAEERQAKGGSKHLCLVIDQFEEVFTLASDKTEAARFVTHLLNAVDSETSGVSVVLTLRSDFLGKCVAYPDLNRYIVDHLDQLEAMTREESEQAIAEPARLVGLHFEGGLLRRILDDLAGQSSDLPLLEHALLELYHRRRGRLLTAAAYTDIGGIEGALARRAEQTYNDLDEEGRKVLRKMFTLCLVTPGEGAEDTRRRATRSELLAVGGNREETATLLDTLVNARLLTSHRDLNHQTEHVDVAHEALIRKWDRIKAWMAEDRETARLLGRLRRRAQSWFESGQHVDHLLRGALLIQMEELVNREGAHVGDLAQAFITAGQALRAREQRQIRRRVQFTILAAIAIAAVTFILFLNANHAESEARDAETIARLAEAHASAKTRESNYHLSMAFNERAGIALDKNHANEAWLASLAALGQDIPDDKDLPESRGRFLDSRMEHLDRLLWTSPTAPQLALVATATDGSLLALAARNTLIYLVDPQTGQQVGLLSEAKESLTVLKFSPDNRYLAAASHNGQRFLWRLADHSFISLPQDHMNALRALAFSPDSRRLFSVDAGGKLLEYDLENETQGSAHELDLSVQAMTFASDPQELILACDQGVYAYDLKRNHLQAWETALQDGAMSVVWHKTIGLVSGWSQGDVLFHQNRQKAAIGKKRHQGAVHQLHLDPTGQFLVSSDGQQSLLWQGSDQEPTLIEAIPGLESVDLDDDGVLTGSDHKGHLWRYDLLHQTTLPAAIGHYDGACSVRFAPDGNSFASGSLDGRILLWDSDAKSPPLVLEIHSQRVYGLDFSPDGQWLASASYDKTIGLWHLPTITAHPSEKAKPSLVIEGHEAGLVRVVFSPDGQSLTSVSEDTTIRTWNLQNLDDPERINYRPSHVLRGHTAVVYEANYTPDGNRLVSSSSDQTIRLWNLNRNNPLKKPETTQILRGHTARVYGVAFSPDTRLIVSVSYDQSMRIWQQQADSADYELAEVVSPHSAPIIALSFSKDGRYLATASDDQTVHIWDVSTLKMAPQPLETLRGHSGGIFALSFSPDGSRLITASDDHSLRLWDLSDIHDHSRKVRILRDHKAPVYGVAFSPDSKHLATTSFDQTILLWGLEQTNAPTRVLKGHSGGIFGAAFSPTQPLLASSSDDHTVRLWSLDGSQDTLVLNAHQDSVYGIDFSPDGSRLATTSEDKTVKIWNMAQIKSYHQVVEPKAEHILVGHESVVYGVDFAPDGKTLVSSSWDHDLRIWDLDSGETIQVLKGHSEPVVGVAFSPDGKTLASGSWDRTVRLWDLDNQKPPIILRGHTNRVSGVAFSPNGDFLVSISDDMSSRVWNLRTGQVELVLRGHSDKLGWYVAFSPDGTFLATPSDDKTVRLWQLNKRLRPPGGDSQLWYRELLHRSLYFMAYRQEGFQLIPQTHMRLGSRSHRLKATPIDHLNQPRPAKAPPAEWLMTGWNPP